MPSSRKLSLLNHMLRARWRWKHLRGEALEAERSRDFRPVLKGEITVGLSSGTSGQRGLFLASPWK